MKILKKRKKDLGLLELIAIALGGMVGGGIFTILGISVAMIGNLTPIAIMIGGILAFFAAYSYVKLGLYYRDEGATYSFFKRTYKNSEFSAAIIGWFVIFGYISTLALYAYTFASYAISSTNFANIIWLRKLIAISIISIFALINIWSVKRMGEIEDIMVYTKLIILSIISILLIEFGDSNIHNFVSNLVIDYHSSNIFSILIVASLTFVAYEGFQLVINAVNDMKNPKKNIPKAIYSAIFLTILIYVVISLGALFSIPIDEIIKNKEYALATGAGLIYGNFGIYLVILGAVLATSSAINGTLFGSSRQMTAIAKDGYFPRFLKNKIKNIPINSIIIMSITASILIIIGELELILEFGSITFLLVSLLMGVANFKIRKKTNSSSFLTILSIIGLALGGIFILYFEFENNLIQMISIIILYILLSIGAKFYSIKNKK